MILYKYLYENRRGKGNKKYELGKLIKKYFGNWLWEDLSIK